MRKLMIFVVAMVLVFAGTIGSSMMNFKGDSTVNAAEPMAKPDAQDVDAFWKWFQANTDNSDPNYQTAGTDYLSFPQAPSNVAARQIDLKTTRIYLKNALGMTRLSYFKDGILPLDITDLELELDFSNMLPQNTQFITIGLMSDCNPSNVYPGMGAGSGMQIRVYKSGAERLTFFGANCADGALTGSDGAWMHSFVVSENTTQNTPFTIAIKKNVDKYDVTYSINTTDEAALNAAGMTLATVQSFTEHYSVSEIDGYLSSGTGAGKAGLMFSSSNEGAPIFFDLKITENNVEHGYTHWMDEYYSRIETYFKAIGSENEATAKDNVWGVVNTMFRSAQKAYATTEFGDLVAMVEKNVAFKAATDKLSTLTDVTQELYDAAKAVCFTKPQSKYYSPELKAYIDAKATDSAFINYLKAGMYLTAKNYKVLAGQIIDQSDEAGLALAQAEKAKVNTADLEKLSVEDKAIISGIIAEGDAIVLRLAGYTVIKVQVDQYETAVNLISATAPTKESIVAAQTAREGIEDFTQYEQLVTRMAALDVKVSDAALLLITLEVDAIDNVVNAGGMDITNNYVDFLKAFNVLKKPNFELTTAEAADVQIKRFAVLETKIVSSKYFGIEVTKGSGLPEDVSPIDNSKIKFTENGLIVPELLGNYGSTGLEVVYDENNKPIKVVDSVTKEEVLKTDSRYGVDAYHNRFAYNVLQTANGYESIVSIDRTGVFASTENYANIVTLNYMVKKNGYRGEDGVNMEARSSGISLVCWLFKGEMLVQVIDAASPAGEVMISTNIRYNVELDKPFQLSVRLRKNETKNRWEIDVNEATLLLTNSQAPLNMFDVNEGKCYFVLENAITIKPASAMSEKEIRLPILASEKQNSNDYSIKKLGANKFAEYEKPKYILDEQIKNATLKEIKVVTLPTKTEYELDENFSLSGLALKKVLLLSDGELFEQSVSLGDIEVIGYDKTKSGVQEITLKVKNTDKSVKFNITVKEAQKPAKGGCGSATFIGMNGGSGLMMLSLLAAFGLAVVAFKKKATK